MPKFKADSWYVNMEDTCFDIIHCSYMYKSWYENNGAIILEFEDFDWSDFEMKKEFTKKDLKEFDIVKLRSGEVFIVLRNSMSRDGLSIFNKAHWGCHRHMHSYNDDLTHNGRSSDDIVAVKKFEDYGIYTLLNDFFTEGRTKYDWDWERKEVEEMTLEEVCKALGKEIKIVKK